MGGAPEDDAPRSVSLEGRYASCKRQLDEVLPPALRARRETAELHTIATWALRVGPSGWALVRGGLLRFTNRAFDALDRGSTIGPRWQALEPGGLAAHDPQSPGRTLRQVVADEAGVLLREGAGNRRTRHSRGEVVVEVTVERSLVPGEGDLALAVVRDISELALAEARIGALQSRLMERERVGLAGELAVGMAHDLGNLVGALSAHLLVLESAHGPGPSLAALRTIVAAQVALIAKLKTVARAAPGKTERLFLATDVVQPAVQVVQSWLGGQDRRRPVWIRVGPTVDDLPPVMGHRDELINVVINVMLNARDAMPDGGLISFAGATAPDRSFLRIEDQGPGIPGDKLEKIFEPLFSTKGERGMGLGLAMARQVTRGLGGQIRARNVPAGGACLELEFPVTAAEDDLR
jgi:signal transduction histidine kinase